MSVEGSTGVEAVKASSVRVSSQERVIFGAVALLGLTAIALSAAGFSKQTFMAKLGRGQLTALAGLGGVVVVSGIAFWRGERIVKAIKQLPTGLNRLFGKLKEHPAEVAFATLALLLGGSLIALGVTSGLMHAHRIATPKHAFHAVANWSNDTVVGVTALGILTVVVPPMIYAYMREWTPR